MKSIEERAHLAARQIFEEIGLSEHSVDRVSEIIAEKILEQKAIDDAECLNRVLTGNGSSINLYNQGFHDAVEKAMFYLKARSEYPFDKLQDSFITFMKEQL